MSKPDLSPAEKALIDNALGYSAEVCEPDSKPITAYITDRWGQKVRKDLYEAVIKILQGRQ